MKIASHTHKSIRLLSLASIICLVLHAQGRGAGHRSWTPIARLSPLRAFLTASITTVDPNVAPKAELHDMGHLDSHAGWVVLGNHLLLTSNDGLTWVDVTPKVLANESIEKVYFLNKFTGWVLRTPQSLIQGRDVTSLLVDSTLDGGVTWKESPVTVDAEIAAQFSGQSEFSFIDRTHGWLLLSAWSSSAFRTAMLFSTADGGGTWTRKSSTTFGNISLVSANVGYVAGGPDGMSLYRTDDNGSTWNSVQLPISGSGTTLHGTIYAPIFTDAKQGSLLFLGLSPSGSVTQTQVFRSSDEGNSWLKASSADVSSQLSLKPSSTLQPVLIALRGSSIQVSEFVHGQALGSALISLPPIPVLPITGHQTPVSSVLGVSFSSLRSGWIALERQLCSSHGEVCRSSFGLLSTETRGQQFDVVPLPVLPVLIASTSRQDN